jgi:pimeloyl-ACP methyl ester carboxylesterase
MLPVRFDDVAGKRVRFFRGGRGPAIVFLHGYPDNLQMWSGVIPLLPDFDCIAFDWPGMGGSEAWAGGATPFAMADRLIALLDRWRIERAAVVAIDMGGQPAAVAAARYPDRVSHLVITGSLLQWNVRTSWEIALLRRFRFNEFALRHLPRSVFRRALMTSIPKLPDEIRDDFWSHFRRAEVRDFIVRMCAGYQGTLPKLPEEYARIAAPILCPWGANDRHFPPSHAIAQPVILEGGQHWLPLQMPEEYARQLRIFC